MHMLALGEIEQAYSQTRLNVIVALASSLTASQLS